MENKVIITSASNKFFPSVVNLIGSIKVNYPNHPPIYIYDLGLFGLFRKELESIDGVTVVTMPPFCKHWRSCYAWKTYIFAHPLAHLNLYMDAGCQVLKSLDEDFSIIEKEDLLLIDQGQSFEAIVPKTYKSIFALNDDFDRLTTIHAGIIGFKNTNDVVNLFDKIFDSACAGLTLGFSRKDKWRNKGKDRNIFERDCFIFRHDMTLLNIFLRKYLNNKIVVRPVDIYDGNRRDDSRQRIWQMRLGYKKLDNLKINILHKKNNLIFVVNRLIISLMLFLKQLNLLLKNKFIIKKI